MRIAGHWVVLVGQMVGVPVPSGQRVITLSTLHRVGRFGQAVSCAGQAVRVPEHSVIWPVQTVGLANTSKNTSKKLSTV